MKTSSISLRVADFLKSYPPFSYISYEDLVKLSGSGRVKFHEEGEHVFDMGEPRGRHFYVIQQGTVNIYGRNDKGLDELVDVRVEGDILGVYWVTEEQPYLYSAITASDTLLYALPFDKFMPLISQYQDAKRYLADYFSGRHGPADAVSESDAQTGQWLTKSGPSETYGLSRYLSCSPDSPIKDVARLVASQQHQAVVVVDENDLPIGIITEADLCARVATGDISTEAPVSELMSSPVMTVNSELTTGDLLLLMLTHGLRHLCVTQDGTPNSPVVGVVAERELQLFFGRLPNSAGRQMMDAPNATALALLRDRADELLREYLETDANMPFLIEYVAQVDGLVLKRALKMAEAELVSRGLEKPDIDYCWLAMHSEGRKERLLRSSQRTAMVYADPPEESARYCRRWFLHLAEEVTGILATCGFPIDSKGRVASSTDWCQPLSVWKANFTKWVQDPVESQIITLTPFFDLRPVAGKAQLAYALRDHIRSQIKANPSFIPLLANDAMANLPPVTIFRDSVMDKAGVLWTCIDTKVHILYPLVDVARVYALELNEESATNTIDRYKRAAAHFPESAELFEAAAEAARVGLAIQSLIGHRRGDTGQYIRPDELDKVDQERLKSIFRTIVKLLDHTAAHFKLA